MTVSFEHLWSLSSPIGTFEHARGREPRLEHGYCVDDVARVLVVVFEHQGNRLPLDELEYRSLRFVLDAHDRQGRVRNRRRADGRWYATSSIGDCWGRSLWALGLASLHACTDQRRAAALARYARSCEQPSVWPRSLAYATLGAAELARLDRVDEAWLAPVRRFVDWFDLASPADGWPWPEARLSYANAVICEAAVAAGTVVERLDLVRRGLELLDWLVEHESVGDHLSPTPVGGAGPGDPPGRFDQQPIEVASLAHAARRAFESTYDERWAGVVERCARWFEGDNDVGAMMWDPSTGAGYDGLELSSVNQNCGAESTLSAMSTMEQREAVRQMLR